MQGVTADELWLYDVYSFSFHYHHLSHGGWYLAQVVLERLT